MEPMGATLLISPDSAAMLGFFAGVVFGGWFVAYFGLFNLEEINEAARLMIFEKNAVQMNAAELWAIIKEKGEGSRDGRIALAELKRRKDVFGDESAVEANHAYENNSIKRLEESK